MPNQYVNKVVQSNGTTLIDISDTTAAAADVASGKYFYLATGEKVEGSGSGGGGMVTENIIPQQSLNCSISLGDGAYGAVISSYVEYPQDGVEYLVTFDGTGYICRGHYRTSSILAVGDYYVTAGATYVEFPFAILLNGGSLFYLAVQGSATHTLKVDRIISYSGGGSATLITKTITQNGTYDAEDDSADGYSSVTVNVAGGNGLEYETGTYTAAADGNPNISFTNSHTSAPSIIVFMDVSTSYIGTTAGTQYGFFDYVKLFGTKLKTSSTLQRDGAYQWARVGSSGSTSLGSAILPDTTAQVTSSGFTPNFNSNTSYKCKSGQTYKWIAIWK